jgi:hypothetical protein
MPASVGLLGVWSMTRRRGLLVGLCLLLAFPIAALAQGVVPEPLPSGTFPLGGAGASGWISGVASLPGLNWIQAGDIRIWPTLNVGYKKIALNFNLNIPPTELLSPFLIFPNYGSLLDTYPLDAKIQSADLAVGAFRLDAQLTPACGLFGSVSANIPRTVGIEASQGPGIGVTQPEAWRWTGSRFQWSEYEFGGWYNINQAVGLVAGIRFDRISVRFSDPEPVPGYSYFTFLPLPPAFRPVAFPDYSGDLNIFFTIPYIGCQIFGPYFKGELLIGSANARLRLPLELSHAGNYITGPLFGFFGRRDISEQVEYTFKNAGLFLEAGLESTFLVGFFNCTLWAKGNWLRIRGDGDVNLTGQSSRFAFFGFLNVPEPFSSSNSGTSTLSQYTFDVGFSSAIAF